MSKYAETNYKVKIPINHPIVSWLCLHAGFCHNRFQIGEDGATPYRRTKGRDFDRKLVEFGECVHYKKTQYDMDPDQHNKKNNFDDRWGEGVFLGVRTRSNELFIGTPEGIVRARSIYRKP